MISIYKGIESDKSQGLIVVGTENQDVIVLDKSFGPITWHINTLTMIVVDEIAVNICLAPRLDANALHAILDEVVVTNGRLRTIVRYKYAFFEIADSS